MRPRVCESAWSGIRFSFKLRRLGDPLLTELTRSRPRCTQHDGTFSSLLSPHSSLLYLTGFVSKKDMWVHYLQLSFSEGPPPRGNRKTAPGNGLKSRSEGATDFARGPVRYRGHIRERKSELYLMGCLPICTLLPNSFFQNAVRSLNHELEVSERKQQLVSAFTGN